MSILTFYLGKQGDKGTDGENGTGVADVDGSLLDNPVLDLFRNNKISETGDLTWERAGDALIQDRYGVFNFISGNDITNFFDYSNDFSFWSDPFTRWSINSTGNSDPLGGSNATHMNLDATTSVGNVVVEQAVSGLNPDLFNTVSFWFKVVSGTITELDVTIGSGQFKVKADLTSSWQRVSVTAGDPAGSALVSIDPVGVSGAVFAIFGAQFENSSVQHDYIETTGAPVTIPNPFPVARSNDLGYLFEDQKDNIIFNSEDLAAANWTIQNGTVLEYQEATLFGDYFKNVNINIGANPTIVINSSATLTPGETYTISFFIKRLGGVIDSIQGSIGGGTFETMGVIDEDLDYTRLTMTGVAGAGLGVDIQIISSNQNANIVALGFQCELGNISSYIRTTTSANTRPEDDVNTPYLLTRPDDQWSLSFNHNSIPDNPNTKYIFNNGLGGVDEFSSWFEDDSLKVNIGSTVTTFTTVLSSSFIGLTYQSNSLNLYLDGLLVDTQTNNGTSGAQPVTLYIGSDETAANSLEGYMSMFKFYDTELNADNMRYLAGV